MVCNEPTCLQEFLHIFPGIDIVRVFVWAQVLRVRVEH